MSAEDRKITVTLGDLRHLFDLAVDSPTICSGSFESIDVDLLRKVAELLGVDPHDITPLEFESQYPHAFKPRTVRAEPLRLWDSWQDRPRMETAEEQRDRIKEERVDRSCQVTRCGKEATHSTHEKRAR